MKRTFARQRGTVPTEENKFHAGSETDGRHYWLTPPDLYAELARRYGPFDHDPCPFPKPEGYDGLTSEWGQRNYVNPPFGSIMHQGRKKGMTAWARKAIAEHAKGKRVVIVFPMDKWVLMLLAAGAKVSNLGDVHWLATEDGKPGPGTGRHIALFVLDPPAAAASTTQDGPPDAMPVLRGPAYERFHSGLARFRNTLVSRGIVQSAAFEDPEGYDGGQTWTNTRLAFEDLTKEPAT